MIELKSVNKIYETEAEKVHALKSVNLTIDKGEFISIMGQSGSGKTTLMNILGCLDTLLQANTIFTKVTLHLWTTTKGLY